MVGASTNSILPAFHWLQHADLNKQQLSLLKQHPLFTEVNAIRSKITGNFMKSWISSTSNNPKLAHFEGLRDEVRVSCFLCFTSCPENFETILYLRSLA
jgi:hypothetical protein